MEVNQLDVVRWDVEEHTGGRAGIGAGPATAIYSSAADAILAMCGAKVRRNGVTCIARNRRGEGRACVLGLIKA